jgi:RHS repeat-associated protein
VWGEDLSGSLQGAGGIGGLLRSVNTTANRELRTENTFHYDSNSNVILLTDTQGRESARYAYDAFGKTLTATGPAARINRYRFSTKPVEVESGLVYYGYRYYDPVTGRWPSRDPIEEKGGVNVYGALQNDFLSAHDVLGLVEGGASECNDDNDVGKIRSSCELTWTSGLHPLADQSAREVVEKVGERYGVPGQISVGIFVAGQAGLQQLLTTFGGNLNFYFRKAEETCTKSSWLGFCVSYSWEKNSENIANWAYFDTMLLNQALTQGDAYIQPFREAWETTVGNCR